VEGRGLKEILLRNKRLKVVALVFAAALWFFVAGQSSTEVGFIVPLGFKGIARDMVMTSTPPDVIEVRVSGPRLIINDMSPARIKVELDLSRAGEGKNSYRLLPRDVGTPLGVKVQRLHPAAIEITLAKLVSVDLPVKVRLTGSPAPGYRTAGVSTDPETVRVSVLKKESGQIKYIRTRPLDLTGLVSDLTVPVDLEMGEHEFRSMSVEKVKVRVGIEKAD